LIARATVVLATVCTILGLAASPGVAATPATPFDIFRLGSLDPQANSRFGDRMKSAGDLDGDGVNDLWIAAYGHDVNGLTDVGRIWAMSGRTRNALYVIDNPQPQACTGFACGLGWTISNLGDVDGDGVNDLAAAANRQNATAGGASCTVGSAGCNASQGKAYVFSGAPGKPKIPLYELNNPQPQANGYFGWASTAGDLVRADGTVGKDGVSEILVGAFQNDFPAGCGDQMTPPNGCRKDQGQAFIFNGAPTLQGGAPRLVRTLDVPAEDRYLNPATGTCVSASSGPTAQTCGGAGIVTEGLGDVNGDGYWDQSLTAWTTGISKTTGQACFGAVPPTTADDCNERQGRIYVFSGLDGQLLRKVDDPVAQEGALFGLQIVQAGAPGDVNGDGFDDIYGIGFQQAGPPRDGNPPLASEGRAWVFSGKDGMVMHAFLDPTPEAQGTFGYALEKTDYDRDGRPDLYMGSFSGSYIFDGDTGALQKIFDLPPGDESGQQPGNTNLGRAVAAPGDLNGDGEPDFLSGSPGHDIGTNLNEGRVYHYLSRVSPAENPPSSPLGNPTPPAPTPVPPGSNPFLPPGPFVDRTAPTGRLLMRRSRVRRSDLLDRNGLAVPLRVSEGATVRADVYVDNGARLPRLSATASQRRRPRLTLLARGSARRGTAGRITVRVRPTRSGRLRLRRSGRSRVILVVTLRDATGNQRRLPRHRAVIGR